MRELAVSRLEMGPRGCKAAILQLNRVGRNISSMEEALVVHSLCHDDGLSQVEIAGLLGRHKSWVSRRVALIARLSGRGAGTDSAGTLAGEPWGGAGAVAALQPAAGA